MSEVRIGNVELDKHPLLLAPMEDVSDPPFRAQCKKFGADLMYTEFISSEGLIRDAFKSKQKLDIYDEERPIGIQIFGGKLESMQLSAEIVERSNPDILDINYGCPVKKVVAKNAGAGILQDIPAMIKLTDAIVKATKLPVTVKTRLGWDHGSIKIVEVAERLQDVGIQAIAIHGRTRKQMYKGEADWAPIGEVKNNPRMKIPVICNGDIDSPEKAKLALDRHGFDGLMIGRAAIGYPWIFREIKTFLKTGRHEALPTVDERVDTCIDHLQRSLDWKGPVLGILEMRRHYAQYFKGFPGIKPYRFKMVTTDSAEEIFETLEEVRKHFKYQVQPV